MRKLMPQAFFIYSLKVLNPSASTVDSGDEIEKKNSLLYCLDDLRLVSLEWMEMFWRSKQGEQLWKAVKGLSGSELYSNELIQDPFICRGMLYPRKRVRAHGWHGTCAVMDATDCLMSVHMSEHSVFVLCAVFCIACSTKWGGWAVLIVLISRWYNSCFWWPQWMAYSDCKVIFGTSSSRFRFRLEVNSWDKLALFLIINKTSSELRWGCMNVACYSIPKRLPSFTLPWVRDW